MTLPQRFGPYLLERLLGSGGMAEVYLAHLERPGFKKQVCIKKMRAPGAQAERYTAMFRDEAALAARLHHPNIVEVFDFGEVEGTLFLAMELVRGFTLGSLLAGYGRARVPFPLPAALLAGIGLCRGLHHAHTLTRDDGSSLGVVHRDVSPQNVLLGFTGEVKVADFGIARAAERLAETSDSGRVRGKAGYMAPEQALGEAVDHRSDQFGAAVVVWEMLTARRLFGGGTGTSLQRVVEEAAPAPSSLRPDVPPELDRAVLRALSKAREERFGSMAHFEDALVGCLLGVTATAHDLDLRPVVLRAAGGFREESTEGNRVAPGITPSEETEPALPAPGIGPSARRSAEGEADVAGLRPGGALFDETVSSSLPLRAKARRRWSLVVGGAALFLLGVGLGAVLFAPAHHDARPQGPAVEQRAGQPDG